MTPDGWRRITIGDLGDTSSDVVQTGPFGAQLHSRDYVADGVPFVLIKNMRHAGIDETNMPRISTDNARRLRKYSLRPGDVVFSRVGRVGSCFLASNEHNGWVISGQLLRIRLPSEAVHREFLVHALRGESAQAFIRGSSIGSTRRSINTEILSSLPVLIPPFPEQRKIAAILSSVNDAIEKTRAVIDHGHVVKRGLMHELLTRGLSGRHTRFKSTEIGELPHEWDARRIGDLASCDYGTSEALKSESGGMPILRMGNLCDGRVTLDDLKYLEREKVPDKLVLSRGDVLFNRTNSAELVGKVAVFDHPTRASFASYLLRLRVEPHIGTGFWLSYALNTSGLQKRLRASATFGVSQVNINRKSLLATLVPVPPLAEQVAIVSILDSMRRRIEVEQRKVSLLAGVKSALMSVLLTGELRVTPDADPG